MRSREQGCGFLLVGEGRDDHFQIDFLAQGEVGPARRGEIDHQGKHECGRPLV